MSAFQIRQGGAGDAALLAALHAPSFADAWPADAFASLMSRAEIFVLLGGSAGEAVQGFILLQCVADEAEVLTFCVTGPMRRLGLGRTLLRAACDAAALRGAAQIFLEVGEANTAALRLYQSEGFAGVGRRAVYYHHGPEAADAIVMRKSLNQSSPA